MGRGGFIEFPRVFSTAFHARRGNPPSISFRRRSFVSPHPRALIIGIDGGTFDVIDPMVASGLLPNIAALLRDGASSATGCTWPAHTAPGWSSFVSASHPGRHGVYQF